LNFVDPAAFILSIPVILSFVLAVDPVIALSAE